jgi:two-component system alkaline phosphatase synthesis response regulator PhoP
MNNKHVLMVEDFPVMQKFYKDALEQAGYRLHIAADGEQALELVTKNQYDVILLDLLLPKINGIEFLERYRDRPSATRVIILTDFADPGRMQRAHELGVTDYLIKSQYPPSELVKKLDQLLNPPQKTTPSSKPADPDRPAA